MYEEIPHIRGSQYTSFSGGDIRTTVNPRKLTIPKIVKLAWYREQGKRLIHGQSVWKLREQILRSVWTSNAPTTSIALKEALGEFGYQVLTRPNSSRSFACHSATNKQTPYIFFTQNTLDGIFK